MKQLLTVTLISGLCLAASCKGGGKGHWSEKEKKEYLAGCVSSATKSFEQRGQAADAAMIQSICSCSLEKIEPKHGYNDVNNMEGTEAKKIMVGIVQQCAQEYITKK